MLSEFAFATHAVEPINRIISVRKTKVSSSDDFSIVRCIDEVEDGGFDRWFREYIAENAAGKPTPMMVTPVTRPTT